MAVKGKCIIFSAPSGAGKTTIVRALINQPALQLEFSVSACSREPRPNEVNGKDYYFLGIEGFKQQIEQDAFIEWEEVYTDHFYGTLRSEIEQIWENGHTVIFDVDVEGGLNLKRFFGKNALAVFVQPPSYDELEKRLRDRSTETEEKIQQRMEKAKAELAKAVEFDVVLVNDTLNHAIENATELVSDFLEAK